MIYRQKIEIEGTVQGVGFRPFVYKAAMQHSISGHVYNDSNGVVIEAQGNETAIENFINSIRYSHPPFAKIDSIKSSFIKPNNSLDFNIIESKETGKNKTLISPEIATCEECIKDISDTANRRYRYPFTNCTNCGPRYTIIEGVPYDRPFTSMKSFKMCHECEQEYINPADRRFHAQPNACPVCGPKLSLVASKDAEILGDAIQKTAELLNAGKIIAIKGLGGFHLACDAGNTEAVEQLRKRKARDEKPFAVMMADITTVRQYCEVSEKEEDLLVSYERPIVLCHLCHPSSSSLCHPSSSSLCHPSSSSLCHPHSPFSCHPHSPFSCHPHSPFSCHPRESGDPENQISWIPAFAGMTEVSNNNYLGIMLPYTPLHYILFAEYTCPSALVMTSGNISDEPICYKNDEALERLDRIADYFLLNDRDIYMRCDDSVMRVARNKPLMLRRARGFVPRPIDIPPMGRETGQILAVGGDLKNTVCLVKDDKAFLSGHIGDLENVEAGKSFKESINHLGKLFDVEPTLIAHDIHPDYYSTRLAKEYGAPLIGIQHHHAHIASCMAENHLEGPVLGIALDGTGWGTDGNVWGGEILIADYKQFERAAHFEYLHLPGGDAAIKNPWQMAVSYIFSAYKEFITNSTNPILEIKKIAPSLQNIADEKIGIVLKMIEQGISSPLTSSCGRLFDAVSALLGIRQSVSFEGQAATQLEMLAENYISSDRYPFTPTLAFQTNTPYITISYTETLKGILDDIRAGVDSGEIARKFHNTVIFALSTATATLSCESNIKDIALSGGCFQNLILTEGLSKSLEASGLNVYTHSMVPPNDGGLSLGQAVIAREHETLGA